MVFLATNQFNATCDCHTTTATASSYIQSGVYLMVLAIQCTEMLPK